MYRAFSNRRLAHGKENLGRFLNSEIIWREEKRGEKTGQVAV